MLQAIRTVPSEEIQQGFYSHYFLVLKKGSTSPYHILDLCVWTMHLWKYTFRILTKSALSFNPSGQLVFSHRSHGCVFSHCHLSANKFLRFCYQVSAYEYLAVPFVLSTKGVQPVCGSSAVSNKEQRHQNILVHRWLSSLLPHVGAGYQGFCYNDYHSQESRVTNKLRVQPV